MSGWLVVNADDLGVSKGANLGILTAHHEGIVTSASLAVTTPFYSHAIEDCVQVSPNLGVGLHFTLTSGKPVSPAETVPLLVDERGYFRWRFLSLLTAVRGDQGEALLEQVALELDAQLHRLHTDGISPDHIDGERHVHLIPEIFSLVVNAAGRHGIGWVRAGADYGRRIVRTADLASLMFNGGFAKSWLLSRLSHRNRRLLSPSLRSADWVASYLYTGRTDLVAPHLAEGIPDSGVIELMVHPGIPSESERIDLGNRELERYLASPGRQRELEVCVSARKHFESTQLTNFSRLPR